MNAVQVVYVFYAGSVYKATLTDRGYLVGALNVILPFPKDRLRLAA